ncbi:chromate transporter [Herbivorax sp. ANBcel31]|uniref:chromate transporter n=1 Tax=Herbivorax sp. ANBcel31 TaxID=3069754 RepID=UPI0027B81502|nr:chromate transporter [Herbivorax sp. ANBcel31]MDQ2086294.1 chromate transporter [Herbivorax sp. ANBcel31]
MFKVFFTIGLFSFGGGYAMISIIQAEMESHGWLSATEFADIIAVSQMTPGPIATNTATYAGMSTSGILGAITSTIGVSLPSFIIMIVIAHYFAQFKENQIIKWILKGIRPVTIGLIFSAVVFLAQASILKENTQLQNIFDFFNPRTIMSQFDIRSTIIFILIFISCLKFKLHPILVVLASALMGIIIF